MSLPSVAAPFLAGYGAALLAGFVPHEARWVGGALLVAALVLAYESAPTTIASAPVPRRAVCIVGALAVAGPLAREAATGSGLSLPEVATIAYGFALLAALGRLDRRLGPVRLGAAALWSLPLVAAPAAAYAAGALLAELPVLEDAVAALVVRPAALALRILDLDAESSGLVLRVATSEGPLALTVGRVCAGVEPAALLVALAAFDALRTRARPRDAAVRIAAALAAAYAANVARVAALAAIGARSGPEALQAAHAHLGWILFALAALATRLPYRRAGRRSAWGS